MHLSHRTTCRVCGSSALTKVIDLGEQHLQGSFVKPGKELPPSRKISCTLVRCDPMRDEHACGLLQMEHTVLPEVLTVIQDIFPSAELIKRLERGIGLIFPLPNIEIVCR